ncbi:MAG: hypothetical protein ACLQJR_35005 [Stellaceae bacterium]
MSRYKSTTRTQMAERHFPVRVRVAVPQGGFGHQYNLIFRWLDQFVGKAKYWHGAGSSAYGAETVFFYFLTVEAAKAFVDRFACGLSVQGEWAEPRDTHG